MKVSDTPFERVEPYLAPGLDVFIGAEGIVAQGLQHGAVGAVSSVAAAFPEAASALSRLRAELEPLLDADMSARPIGAWVNAPVEVDAASRRSRGASARGRALPVERLTVRQGVGGGSVLGL